MFVATKEIRVTLPGQEKQILFRPGDEVVGFEKWAEIPKRAHLNLGYVVKQSSPPKAPSKKRAKKG